MIAFLRYWLLRSLKDAIVITTMGEDYIPNCKMMSLVVVLSLVRPCFVESGHARVHSSLLAES